jgi:fatty acid-binding protein DegV
MTEPKKKTFDQIFNEILDETTEAVIQLTAVPAENGPRRGEIKEAIEEILKEFADSLMQAYLEHMHRGGGNAGPEK